MHSLLLALLVFQSQTVVREDSVRVESTRPDSATSGSRRQREPRRVEVTDADRRTAFRSPAAERMLLRARAARLEQDSALRSYEAAAYLRISAGMGFSKLGRDRLIFRHENASTVRWHRDVGAWIEVKGARTHLPASAEDIAEENANMAQDADMTPVPYYPGYEPLLTFGGNGLARATVDEREMVHPIATGAEAYYTYATGDSVVFRLPDGTSIQLRELLVRPRKSAWNVVIGSLWFDAASGQLVRAAYRLAVPMDIWAVVKEDDPEDYEEIPIWVRPALNPMIAQVTAIGVEYGLYRGRFWLPRLRSAEGHARVSFMRVPFKYEQSFRYSSVNAIDSLPSIVIRKPPSPPDSLSERGKAQWRDSVFAATRQALRDSVRLGLRTANADCDAQGFRTRARHRSDANMDVAVLVPCDPARLTQSAELPGSLYEDGEELFGSAELDVLKKEALSMGVQPPMAIGRIPPSVHYGLQFTRFNRVEGLSSGVRVDQPMGSGYTLSVFGRIGHADLEPNGELTLERSNSARLVRLRGYHRLVAANDWGNPLSFGSSVSALLFGRDEGFYYRATGVELEWARADRSTWSYRAFAEQQGSARVENEFSLGAPFIPNVAARRARYAGGSARFMHTRGLDPNGFRLFSDFRLEGGAADSAGAAYGRAALDLTVTTGLGRAAAALTVAGGSSVGTLPPQRRWYLGGAHTVRGQFADTASSGDAFWLSRLELGTGFHAARPVIFGDIGWVGDRDRMRDVGRPLSGVGVGVSILDGLVRVDLARGIHPGRRIRADMYVEARF